MSLRIQALYLLSVSAIALAAAPPVRSQEEELRHYSYMAVAKAAVMAAAAQSRGRSATLSRIDPAALILSLGYAGNRFADDALIELLDFYLGESHAQAIFHAVTRNGKRVESKLDARLETVPSCLSMSPKERAEFAGTYVKCLDKAARNKRIARLLELIRRGEVVDYVL